MDHFSQILQRHTEFAIFYKAISFISDSRREKIAEPKSDPHNQIMLRNSVYVAIAVGVRTRRRSFFSPNLTTRLSPRRGKLPDPRLSAFGTISRAGGTPPPTTSVTGPDYHFVPTRAKRGNMKIENTYILYARVRVQSPACLCK